ncbi:MAG: phosphate signaling complex protein PhoU [Luteolibacter sp.]|uniref:phosphate signaling complex protein PhoU n=1 Tax=Luteolibacter sp. TaxID=1962973 RepID=UPI0032654491
MNSPHIFRDFDKAMESLKGEVLTMASLTRQNLEKAMRSLLERDIDLARTVIADDSDVDDLERKIDQAGMDILVRFHPVASDLRLVITSMKMAHNLERISDHAVNIAKRSKKICKAQPLEEASLAEPLYSLADKLLRDALMAYTDANSELGEGLKARDKELDRLHKQMIASLSGRLEDSNGRSENLLHLIFVARSIERIGDLAVNIGEDAVFLGEARDIRHEYRKQASSEEQAD